MGSARQFLEQHPELGQWKERSQIWPQVKQRHLLRGLDDELYRVQGDLIGDEDDLLVDALARGGADQSPDPLALQLFQELTPEMQQLVRRDLLKVGEEGERK